MASSIVVDHSRFFGITRESLATVDAQHQLVAVNPAWIEAHADPGDGPGRDLLAHVHADDRDRVRDELAAVPHASSVVIAARLRTRHGGFAPHELSCARAEAPARELYLAARPAVPELAAATAALAFQQRRLAAVLAALQDEVYFTDEHGVIDGLGRPPAGVDPAAVLGTRMLDWSAPDERAAMEARYREVRETAAIVTYDTAAQYPDGSIQYMASRMGPIVDGERSAGAVLITRNVTQERHAEAAKQRAEQQVREYTLALERSNSELERFASVASHDLQEPLRKIDAFGGRLHDRFKDELPATARDYLTRIRDAARRMQVLINDLLLFSRLSATKQTFVPTNLADIARSVLSDLEVRIEEVGGKVQLGPLPVIDADPIHMRQLFQNLIGNALKFARSDAPPVVTIRATIIPPADPLAGAAQVRVEFADNGIGIEPRFHERIFGIFERLHGRAKYEGTGIGLAVCRKIVERHNGHIELTSVVGQGTTFTVVLPKTQLERG